MEVCKMNTDKLVGLFVNGSVKTGPRFYGLVYDVDTDYIYLKYKGLRKIIAISEISEMRAEAFDADRVSPDAEC